MVIPEINITVIAGCGIVVKLYNACTCIRIDIYSKRIQEIPYLLRKDKVIQPTVIIVEVCVWQGPLYTCD
jgi:hypothetical protein